MTTVPAWDSMTPEQQRAEWARFHAWQAAQYHPAQMAGRPVYATPRPPAGPRLGWIIIASVVGALLLVVAAFALIPDTTTVRGDLTVTGSSSASYLSTGGACTTYGGYSEIGNGTTVTVRGADGDIIATGSLGPGTGSSGSCVFGFSVPDVPRSEFYTVEIAKRGPLTYSADEVESGSIHQELTSSLW